MAKPEVIANAPNAPVSVLQQPAPWPPAPQVITFRARLSPPHSCATTRKDSVSCSGDEPTQNVIGHFRYVVDGIVEHQTADPVDRSDGEGRPALRGLEVRHVCPHAGVFGSAVAEEVCLRVPG